MTLLSHYWQKLRAADATWHRAHADSEDSAAFLPPSLRLALGILAGGLAIALLGVFKYLGVY